MFRLGVGPMSDDINRIINEYAKENNIMVVASRNQVDYKDGYVCKTAELPSYFTNAGTMLCRDHCGPYFKDLDKNKSIGAAMEECFRTIDADIDAGFDLIHVDVSRIPEKQLDYARTLIEYILKKSPGMKLEFGSENNTGHDLVPSASRLEEQLEFIKEYKDNIIFFVTQTGSFTQHTQVGNFDVVANSSIVEKVHNAGFRFKEHNADYLSRPEVELRKLAKVDAMNIAPQLGAVQTSISRKLSATTSGVTKEWHDFAQMVYSNNLWQKWMPLGMNDPEMAVQVSGHYFFDTAQYQAVLSAIDGYTFRYMLRAELFSIFNCYHQGLL